MEIKIAVHATVSVFSVVLSLKEIAQYPVRTTKRIFNYNRLSNGIHLHVVTRGENKCLRRV